MSDESSKRRHGENLVGRIQSSILSTIKLNNLTSNINCCHFGFG